MKKTSTKRKLLVISAIAILIAILSMGSLAWFTATDTVENEFRVAIDGDNQPDFGIDVVEHKPDPDDPSQPTDELVGDDDDPEGNTYEDIAPGDTFSKDPTVKNVGQYSAWVRAKVVLTEAAAWKAAFAAHPELGDDISVIFKTVDDAKWTAGDVVEDATENTLTFVYYLNAALGAGEEEVLFTQVEIPSAFTQADMVYDNGSFKVTVKSDAIQEKNTGASAQEAFALIDA